MSKEKEFLRALSKLFIGAQVEGVSGFINLMSIKRRYFEQIRLKMMKVFEEVAAPASPFREELFDKLHAFFSRYFCETGSVYFRHIPAFYPARESVYASGEDVELLWKTRDLYYVKSDRLICSMPVEWTADDGSKRRFYFDVSGLQNKQSNERREFLFTFAGVDQRDDKLQPVIKINVSYSFKGKKTKIGEMIKGINAGGGGLC